MKLSESFPMQGDFFHRILINAWEVNFCRDLHRKLPTKKVAVGFPFRHI